MIKDKQDLLLSELEELIAQLAQQTDSKTTNLQVYVEEQRKEVDAKDRKRWAWFLTIVTSVILAIGVLTFEMWERQYDRISNLGREVTKNVQSIDYLKDQMLRRYELREKLDELSKQRDIVRDKKDVELLQIVQKLETTVTTLPQKDAELTNMIKELEKSLKELQEKHK